MKNPEISKSGFKGFRGFRGFRGLTGFRRGSVGRRRVGGVEIWRNPAPRPTRSPRLGSWWSWGSSQIGLGLERLEQHYFCRDLQKFWQSVMSFRTTFIVNFPFCIRQMRHSRNRRYWICAPRCAQGSVAWTSFQQRREGYAPVNAISTLRGIVRSSLVGRNSPCWTEEDFMRTGVVRRGSVSPEYPD